MDFFFLCLFATHQAVPCFCIAAQKPFSRPTYEQAYAAIMAGAKEPSFGLSMANSVLVSFKHSCAHGCATESNRRGTGFFSIQLAVAKIICVRFQLLMAKPAEPFFPTIFPQSLGLVPAAVTMAAIAVYMQTYHCILVRSATVTTSHPSFNAYTSSNVLEAIDDADTHIHFRFALRALCLGIILDVGFSLALLVATTPKPCRTPSLVAAHDPALLSNSLSSSLRFRSFIRGLGFRFLCSNLS